MTIDVKGEVCLKSNMIRQAGCMDYLGFAWATSSSEAVSYTSAVIKSHTLAFRSAGLGMLLVAWWASNDTCFTKRV